MLGSSPSHIWRLMQSPGDLVAAAMAIFKTTCCSSSCSRSTSTCRGNLTCSQAGRLRTCLAALVALAATLRVASSKCNRPPLRTSSPPLPISKSSNRVARLTSACRMAALLRTSVPSPSSRSLRMVAPVASLASRARTGSSRWARLSK